MFTLKEMNILKFAIISTIFLSGCSANHYSIHRAKNFDSDKSSVISVDAKQRFLLSNVITKTSKATDGTSTATEKIRRFCAEPSPDVFSVLSQAASGSGSFGQTADPKSLNIALNGAFSGSETGSAISRTQTINMLKEMMYRTCESYLNGQISDFEYPIIAARDQRIMTSILAIEQLTGSVLPKPVVVAVTGNASTGQSTNDAILSPDNANKKVAEKKDAFETSEKELKNAKIHHDAIVSLAGKPGPSSATTGGILLSSSPTTEMDKQIEQARFQTIQGVANVIDNIVTKSFNQADETSFFCYRIIEKNIEKDIDKKLTETCLNFIAAKVENETARLRLETEETTKQIEELRKSSFEKFWDKIKNGSDQVDKDKLKEIIDKKFPQRAAPHVQEKLEEMKKKNTKDDILKIFNMLSLGAIDKLLKD